MATTFDVLAGYVRRPDYAREAEPKGFPNASYSPAQYERDSKGSIGALAQIAMIAYSKACASRLGRPKKPSSSVDLRELTEDKLIYRRKR